MVVEDDPTVAEVVARYLQRDGYEVDLVADGITALERIAESGPDLVVLDIMLPGMDGLEVCARVREDSGVPIVLLTAMGGESDRIAGLELGADDYITKPFSPRELVARVNAVLRRTGRNGAPGGTIAVEDLQIDLDAHEVRKSGRILALTAREFDLLAHLATNSRVVFTREQLLEEVWGYTFGDQSTVTVHVRRLREKVEDDPARPRHISTVWGVGYRFDP
ncbi:MAG TPA: response regulator transcription factor [Actinomycetota bacterium]|nr:response regulator transcription factor [Actinomycetota bacterium]